ncbi:MAG: ribosome maturation factor RimM [Erysipelotrichaceae bacterium]|nr:ribosome maturation factor RimM [Erysipelotrichaceae bacterium]
MDKVRIGKIINTFGIRGELKVLSMTDFPDERFAPGAHMFIRRQGKDIDVEITSHRVHKGYDLVTINNLRDINLVEQYKGLECYAFKDEELLDEDEYYFNDLVGCKVYNYGELIGEVEDVYENMYQDILAVDHNGKRLMIPYVEAFVKAIDIDEKRIDVELIKGFIDDED